ncbi:MAG TPA: ABC transporter permease [Candidatus Angelobacter sp.]
MIRYFGRRLFHAVLVLFGVSLLMFLVQQAAPGDFLSEMRLNPQISPQALHTLRAQYGLDQPLPLRYAHWLSFVARGEFGYSFAYDMPASKLLWPRARNTLLLTVPALLISWLIAVPLGVLAAAQRGTWLGRLFSGGTSFLLAVPDVLLALLALMIALRTGLFPVGGMRSADPSHGRLADLAWHMVLPVGTLVLGSLPVILRHVRAAVSETLSSCYVRAAEGHGLRQLPLLFRHALPAAANPLISLFGISIAFLLSVSLLVETVMSWPGMGPLLLESILARDLFVVLGATMLSTLFPLAGNLIADVLLYGFDPRIRMEP